MTNIVLADMNGAVVSAWRELCADLEAVTVHQGSIFDVACDAIVSPANSFGFMDGGIDLAISRFFGWHVQERLQDAIRTSHHGELLVGASEIIPTDHSSIPYVIAAPTMRVPMVLGNTTINVYLAMRAVLLMIKYGSLRDGTAVKDVVKTIAVPGLATGVGRVSPTICAKQMRTAIEEVLLDNNTFPGSWIEAQTRHQLLYTDNPRDLQFPS